MYRSTQTVERTREAQSLERELENAGIKISSVASDIVGVSGWAMLAALIAGEDDTQVMAETGPLRPGTGRHRRRDAGSKSPTTGGNRADHQPGT